jgi:hypothetical protein
MTYGGSDLVYGAVETAICGAKVFVHKQNESTTGMTSLIHLEIKVSHL